MKKMYRKLVGWLDSRSAVLRARKQTIAEHLEIRKMLKSAPVNGKKLSKEQIQQVKDYWRKIYGKEISPLWHQKYTGYSGKFDVQYFPEILYTTKLEPLGNPEMIAKVLVDKSLIEILYSQFLNGDNEIVVPTTICGCANGFFYDGSRMPSDRKQVEELLAKLEGKYIIKPTVGGSSGHGVRLLDLYHGVDCKKNEKVSDILSSYGKNFIVQERIMQHPVFAALHPDSINTIRVMTYRKDGEIKAAPCIMRIGAGRSHLDNAHAGGMYIAVSDEGILQKKALRNYSEPIFIHPDTNIAFDGYRLPGMKKIIQSAKLLHTCLPSIGFVNWDFSYDENENVVLIESNMNCGSLWLFQNTWGKGVFGEDTEYFAKMISN